MSKMFYTLAEAAGKLGKSEAEVRAMIESNTIQEFRDGEKVMLKVEQVDLLAGDDDDLIPLADSGELEPISLSGSGSASVFGLDESEPAGEPEGEQTGISIFDPEGEDEVDPSAATQISGTMGATMPSFGAASASGSGLANIAIDADDTSFGGSLLEDVYGDGPAGSGAPADFAGASAVMDAGGELFETEGAPADDFNAPAMAGAMGAMLPEAYDGPGSGIFGGLAFGISAVCLIAITIMVLAISGGGSVILSQMDQNWVFIVPGIGALLAGLGAGLGFVLLRKG